MPDDRLGLHVLIGGLEQTFDCLRHPAMFASCNHGRQNTGVLRDEQKREYWGDYSV
jgi:hypothetical protein